MQNAVSQKFHHKRVLVAIAVGVVALLAFISLSAAASGSSQVQSSTLVATIHLSKPQTISSNGISVTFDTIQIYNNKLVLHDGSTTALSATMLGGQTLAANVSLGSTTVISMNDPSGIQVVAGGYTLTFHSLTITAEFNRTQLISLSWQAS